MLTRNFFPCLALLLAWAPAPSASGRVGDTEKELVARYGQVTGRQPARKYSHGKMFIVGERVAFKTAEWTVSAVVIAGRCEEISYRRADKWSDAHFLVLLDLNGGYAQWTEHQFRNPAVNREWQRVDKASASWGNLSGFMVRTPAAEQAIAQVEQSARSDVARAGSQ